MEQAPVGRFAGAFIPALQRDAVFLAAGDQIIRVMEIEEGGDKEHIATTLNRIQKGGFEEHLLQ